MSQDQAERRRFPRLAVDLPATVRTVGAELVATVRNISRTGAMIDLGRALSVPAGCWVVLVGYGAGLRGCDARVVEASGTRWRLAFDPALPAADLRGVAAALA